MAPSDGESDEGRVVHVVEGIFCVEQVGLFVE